MIRLLLGLVLAIGYLSSAPAHAASPIECTAHCPDIGNLPDGYRYVWSAADQSIYQVHGVGGTEVVAGRTFRFDYLPACVGNVPGSAQGGDNLCAFAVQVCPPPEIGMWRWHQELVGGQPVGGWTQDPGVHCLRAAVGFPLADLRASFARYLREQHLPPADLTVQPAVTQLVNLPVLFSSTPQQTRVVDVAVPLPARLQAEPHWAWSFGDGASGPDSPGRPYDPAVSPSQHPDFYVAHAYRSTDARTVLLTVTWSGTFVVPGISLRFPLTPVVFTATAGLAPREARAELVAG